MARQLYSLKSLIAVAEDSTMFGNPAAIGAFNVNFYAQAEGILCGLAMAKSPGIIQASKGANKFQGGAKYIREIVFRAMDKISEASVPICLHLDHGDYKSAEECIDSGFSSVMADFSTTSDQKRMPLEENLRLTKEVVSKARVKGVSVEGEIGVLQGKEEDKFAAFSIYPSSEEVVNYAMGSGIDAVAVACGTCHGPVKDFRKLELELLADSYRGLRAVGLDTGIVLHGSSNISREFVEELGRYGGEVSKASGIPIEAIKKAIRMGGVRKVNIDTDLRMGITIEVRKYILENPGVENESQALGLIKKYLFGNPLDKNGNPINIKATIDPRDYLGELMKVDPDLLREDYRFLGDKHFALLMERVRNRVAGHVHYLVKEFGSAGLAGIVDARD